MPPQPGMFPLSYPSSHKVRSNDIPEMNITYQHHQPNSIAGPSSRIHGKSIGCLYEGIQRPKLSCIHSGGSMDDGKKERRRREIAGKLGKEMNDRRDE